MWSNLIFTCAFLVIQTMAAGTTLSAFSGDTKIIEWNIKNPDKLNGLTVRVFHPLKVDNAISILFTFNGAKVILTGTPLSKRVTNTNGTNTANGRIKFTLNNITVGDAGTYRAGYQPSGGNWLTEVGPTLVVYVKPSKPDITEVTLPIANDIMTLNCSVRSNSRPRNLLTMKYKWYLNSKNLPAEERYNATGSLLQVKNIQKSDAGTNFACQAYENSKLLSEFSDVYNVNVQYGPDEVKLTPPEQQYSLREFNDTLNAIDCYANCIPPCNYTWLYGDKNVSPDKVLKTITNIKRNMAGKYTCKVANRHGKLEASITVVVQYAPGKPVLSISGPNVTEGTQVRLQCSTDSVPSSRIIIYGENATTLNDDNKVLSSNFTIPSANCLDAGLFYCSAENMIGNSISIGRKLNVLCKPRPDHRVSHEFKQALGTGENMNISGTLISNPLPNIYWSMRLNGSSDNLRNGTKGFMFHNTKEVLTVTSRATRTYMRQDDFGEYVMHAQNPYGNATLVYSVTPRRIPDEPKILAILCNFETQVEIKFEPHFDGGDTQFFSIEMKSDSEVDFKTVSERVPDSKQDVMTLRGPHLAPSATHFFRIVSTNSFGTTYSINQLNCTIEQEPTQGGAIIGGAVGGSLFFAVILIGILIFLKRRRTKEMSDATELMNGRPLNADQDDPDDGIQPNILHESAGPRNKPQYGKNDSQQRENLVIDVYAKVVKPKAKVVNNDVYAKVVKPKGEEKKNDGIQPNILHESAGPRNKPQYGKNDSQQRENLVIDVYAKVVKPKAKVVNNDVYAKVVKPKGEEKKKQKYGSVDQNGAPNNTDGDVYENAPNIWADNEQPTRKTNDEGLVYIDVEITGTNTNQTKAVIHEIENKSEYAEVVFTPGAAPLPPDIENDNGINE